jgi:hypothetical protein
LQPAATYEEHCPPLPKHALYSDEQFDWTQLVQSALVPGPLPVHVPPPVVPPSVAPPESLLLHAKAPDTAKVERARTETSLRKDMEETS